jgi:hypothetical protein
MLPRRDYMKLVGYTREQYDARARRGQLANPHEIPASQLLQPLHALLNVFQDELHAQLGMPLAHASRLAHDVKYWLVVGYEPDAEKRWSILVKSAHDLRSENHDPRLYDPRLNQLNHRPHVHDLPSNNHALRGGRGVIHVLAGGINGRDAIDLAEFWAKPARRERRRV